MTHVETFTLGELQENAYLLLDDDRPEAVVIDPGDYPTRLVNRIEEAGKSLAAILLTHGHWDHVAGVRELRLAFDAPIYLHEADGALYEHVVEQAELFGFHVEPQPPVTHTLRDGDLIEIGPFRFDVLHTPGHTPGGVSFKIEDVVFVGDALFAGSIGRSDLPGGSPEKLVEAIHRKILTLDDAIVLYPGHGPATTVGEERRSNPFLS